ncbi:MAG TPA: DUF5597 domain-containing protein [Woeseiaceae bacterium]
MLRSLLAAVSLFALALCTTATGAQGVQLRQQGEATQLVIDGAPFLMLAGELGNSSASDLDYLRPRWATLEALHLNTVLAPVYWELVEPEEGAFDFSLVDGLIRQAREHDMRLVLLWFGSWKNSMSSYAPAWVKRDQARFPRAEGSDGRGFEILSPFSSANRDADARAFAALMRHLREIDRRRHTVLMVQVENEIGMIPEARDHSAAADAEFAGPVPGELMQYLARHRDGLAPALRARWEAHGARTSGSWEHVFGEGPATEEIFMAWHFARYTEAVAAAGQAEYDLPMYVNAALIRPGYAPGAYPSAGPLPQVFDVWRAGAPSIDFLAPDIYFPNFVEWARAYDVPGNAFFVPETGRQPAATPANAFYAFGAHGALGFSPFAIEDFAADDPLGQAYDVLAGLAPLILEHQGKDTLAGVRPAVAFDGTVDDAPAELRFASHTLRVAFVDPFTPREEQDVAAHGGLIIQLGPQEYVVAGKGLTVTFRAGQGMVGIEQIREGRFVAGRWVPGRVLNGDQSHQGRHLRLPPDAFGIQRVRLYRYR